MKIYNYNLWDGKCEILNAENLVTKWFKKPSFNVDGNLVVFMSSINSPYYAFYYTDENNYLSYKSFKKLSSREIEIIRKEIQ